MRLISVLAFGLLVMLSQQTNAQKTTTLEGYVFEENNRGYLRNVRVSVLKDSTQEIFAEAISDKKGVFTLQLPLDMKFRLVAEKKHFISIDTLISTEGLKADSKSFVKVSMERRPGYVFDVTIAEANRTEAIVDAIKGARIEVFNNTTGKEELVLNNYPHPNFKFNFEKGNHYTLMIRRKGYLNKRIEAYIDVEGCILCFDGLGIVDPGVTDVMTSGHEKGTFLANIDLEPAKLNKTFQIENIYYDYNQHNIREDAANELNKVIGVLKDNPAIIIEMGSHTDARGKDYYNMNLSSKRAKAAVDYLIKQGIDSKRLTWKGYGETNLANQCDDGVPCDEDSHQKNRRTELKIVGFQIDDPLEKQSLQDIIVNERLMKEVMEGEVIRVDKDNKIIKEKNKAQN